MMKITKHLILFSLILACTSSMHARMLVADGSCIDITTTNRETFVEEQGPLRYVGCTCPCTYEWTETGMCSRCTHRHADGKTFGNIIDFDNSWLSSLIAYTEKKTAEKKARSANTEIPIAPIKKNPSKKVALLKLDFYNSNDDTFADSQEPWGYPTGNALGDTGIPGDYVDEGGPYNYDSFTGGGGTTFNDLFAGGFGF